MLRMKPEAVVVATTLLIAVLLPFGEAAEDPMIVTLKCLKGFKGIPDSLSKVMQECRSKHGNADHCYNLCLRDTLGYFKKNALGEVTGVDIKKIRKVSDELFSEYKSQEKKAYDFSSCFRSFRKPHLFKITGRCDQLKPFDKCYAKKMKNACKFKG